MANSSIIINIAWFFKKQMHHNKKKIRAYGCSIGHSDERKKLSQIDIAADEVRLYADSWNVLHYFKNESKKHPVFITNHLHEIHLHLKLEPEVVVDWNLMWL